jgi:hypothetical protein
MITETKFYKPRVARLTDGEHAFFNKSLDSSYGRIKGVSGIDFVLTSPSTIMTRRIAMRSLKRSGDMGPFQITYNFSSKIRNNLFTAKNANKALEPILSQREYGASGWSFRALYEFLCEYYNGGHPFVDTYFDSVFKTRPAYKRFLVLYNDVQDKLNAAQFDIYSALPLKSDGSPDERYGAYKDFKSLKWQDPIIKQSCKDVADEIRADIVRCLYSGRIPMSGRISPTVADRTARARAELDAMRHPNRLFFASGQLISNLNIFVEITKDADAEGRAA